MIKDTCLENVTSQKFSPLFGSDILRGPRSAVCSRDGKSVGLVEMWHFLFTEETEDLVLI